MKIFQFRDFFISLESKTDFITNYVNKILVDLIPIVKEFIFRSSEIIILDKKDKFCYYNGCGKRKWGSLSSNHFLKKF